MHGMSGDSLSLNHSLWTNVCLNRPQFYHDPDLKTSSDTVCVDRILY